MKHYVLSPPVSNVIQEYSQISSRTVQVTEFYWPIRMHEMYLLVWYVLIKNKINLSSRFP